jgi:hypothetical protein
VRLPPRIQGDLGEASALAWLVSQGACVSVPFNSSPDYDLVADFGDGRGLVRVQVKTSQYRTPKGRWAVAICTRGGNQSWSGLVKRFDRHRCDYLFALVGDGRRWFLPADSIEATTSVALGGPKYAEFEIEPGVPLTADGTP